MQIEAAIKQQVRGPLWESTWKAWQIFIAFRKDRSPLLALCMDRPGENPHHICQFNLAKLKGDLASEASSGICKAGNCNNASRFSGKQSRQSIVYFSSP